MISSPYAVPHMWHVLQSAHLAGPHTWSGTIQLWMVMSVNAQKETQELFAVWNNHILTSAFSKTAPSGYLPRPC